MTIDEKTNDNTNRHNATINGIMASDKYTPREKVGILNSYEEGFRKTFSLYMANTEALSDNFKSYSKVHLKDALATNSELIYKQQRNFDKFNEKLDQDNQRMYVILLHDDNLHRSDDE